jgi:hypothetical protein
MTVRIMPSAQLHFLVLPLEAQQVEVRRRARNHLVPQRFQFIPT